MTCEHCQEQISAFLDNDLDAVASANVQTHLAVCAECAKLCEDFASILDFCQVEEPAELLPPNSQALWCRINNIIESEVKTEIKPENQIDSRPEKSRVWSLSFAQLSSAVLCIAIVSSLLTFIGITNYSADSAANDTALASSETPTLVGRVLGKIGLIDTPQQIRERRIAERKAAIEYWNKRVEARRIQWDKNLRDAFDRNLNEINQAVNEYTMILQQNPQDELSGEMLDSALNEKADLLREFSDL